MKKMKFLKLEGSMLNGCNNEACIYSVSYNEVKEKLLPLQGPALWHKWPCMTRKNIVKSIEKIQQSYNTIHREMKENKSLKILNRKPALN